MATITSKAPTRTITEGVRLLPLDQRLWAVGFGINTSGVGDGAAETANRDGRLRPGP